MWHAPCSCFSCTSHPSVSATSVLPPATEPLHMQFRLLEMAFPPFFMLVFAIISHTLAWSLPSQRSFPWPPSWVTSFCVGPLSTSITRTKHMHGHNYTCAWLVDSYLYPLLNRAPWGQRPSLSCLSLCSQHLSAWHNKYMVKEKMSNRNSLDFSVPTAHLCMCVWQN